MKTLTITVSDDVAAELEARAVENGSSSEDLAAQAVADTYDPSWLEGLSAEDRAGIAEGWAQAERGEFASDEEVNEIFSRFGR